MTSAADMIAMVEVGTVQPPPWTANGGRHGQVSAFGTKAAQRGVYSAPRGECGLLGRGRSARTSFHVRDESRSEGRLFDAQGQMRLTRPWAVGHGRAFMSVAKAVRSSRTGGARLYSLVTRIQSPIKGKAQKTPFSKIGEYTDTFICYILCFPYFPVSQPVEKCIQSQLIQTEYTARIGEYKAAFVYDSVTIGPACIQSGSLGASTATPARHTP